MTIRFEINYVTAWGESVVLRIDDPRGGEYAMAHAGGGDWAVDVDTDLRRFGYSYLIKRGDKVVRTEWGALHSFTAGRTAASYRLLDRWQDIPEGKPFYSQAFTRCINRRPQASRPLALRRSHLMVEVEAPAVAPGHDLVICGNCDALGRWDPSKAPRLNDAGFPVFAVNIDCRSLPEYTEYKFVVVDRCSGAVVAWEPGDNRRLALGHCAPAGAVRVGGLRLRALPVAPWRGAGVAIPVFSLRSDDDFGVGDFYDLKKMIDWAALTGQRFVQILPVNDTTMTGAWTDSYPYNANSTFALHPMYLRVSELGRLDDRSRARHYEQLRAELNALDVIDYAKANSVKLSYLREVYALHGYATLRSDDFAAFVGRNIDWLKPYAAFCVLRDNVYHTPEFDRWGEYAVYDAARVDRFVERHLDEINLVYYIQYHLDRQLRHVREYAHSRGVALKGDIPIGISRTSVDAWLSPRLFNLDSQAGAPPDDFSVLGQNWGFPTYNWDEMALDGYAWWKARFRKMAEYFDAYRIDHILGFFRIWQIPRDSIHGLLGFFNPALPLSPDEMLSVYGFDIDAAPYTRPVIERQYLADLLGDAADAASLDRYLMPCGEDGVTVRPEFDTQRKVVDHFASLPPAEADTRLCDALMRLLDDVLLIEDPYQRGKYHPRISAQNTYRYRSLTEHQRWCFDRMYNDFFYRRHDEFWYHKAMEKLPPLIDATSMLTCAEDLGMIPHCVPEVMDRLEILTLDIQRMPKQPYMRFGDPMQYPYYTVCTTSTHDMGGIRQWWEENRSNTEAFYHVMLHEEGPAPHFAESWVCEKILSLNLASPAMLCILPLQDWLSIDGRLRRANPYEEQINVPSDSHHYWRYRMHITLEQLLDETLFNRRVKELVANSGRS